MSKVITPKPVNMANCVHQQIHLETAVSNVREVLSKQCSPQLSASVKGKIQFLYLCADTNHTSL